MLTKVEEESFSLLSIFILSITKMTNTHWKSLDYTEMLHNRECQWWSKITINSAYYKVYLLYSWFQIGGVAMVAFKTAVEHKFEQGPNPGCGAGAEQFLL